MIPTGLAFAASGLVGNCIGMNQVKRAKQYECANLLYGLITTSIILFILYIFSHPLVALFTTDINLIKMTEANLWALYIFIFWSTLKGVQNGVIRALGKQKMNTFVTLGIAYGLGVPMAYLFCFVKPINMGL